MTAETVDVLRSVYVLTVERRDLDLVFDVAHTRWRRFKGQSNEPTWVPVPAGESALRQNFANRTGSAVSRRLTQPHSLFWLAGQLYISVPGA